MSLLIISHSYISEENQKNILALSHYLIVRAVVPESFESRVFKTIKASVSSETKNVIKILKAIHLPRSQYILRPFALDLFEEPTEVINIEYDPWSVMFWQAIAARKRSGRKCKVVCTIKNNTYTFYPGLLGRLKLAIARRGIANVDLFFASSENVARMYHERFSVPREKILMCYHLGVDTDLFCPVTESRPRANITRLVVGYCGRFNEDKGILDLIEAVKDCRLRRGADLELHLLGNGVMRNKILQMKEENPWIKVFDPMPPAHVPRFLQALDIFVLPSRVSPAREEHDAHALVEALAVGLPCIGTQSGIIPELLAQDEGLLVPANSSHSLADAIAKLAANISLRDLFGRKARAKILEEHAIDSLAKKKAVIFKRLGCN